MNKSDRHSLIHERCEEAIRNLYHNATPSYPRTDDESFMSWFENAARDEIDYINSGGAYGPHYSQSVRENAARRFHSDRARQRYHSIQMRVMRLDQSTSSGAWERITEYGRVYQYGRGGRTLAPEGLVTYRGSPDEVHFSRCCIFDVVEAIQIIEAFNRYVGDWCKAVPEMWKETQEELA